jgi:hypothetical protein
MKRIVGTDIGDGCHMICNADPDSTTLSDASKIVLTRDKAAVSDTFDQPRNEGAEPRTSDRLKVAEDAASGEDMQVDYARQFLCATSDRLKVAEDGASGEDMQVDYARQFVCAPSDRRKVAEDAASGEDMQVDSARQFPAPPLPPPRRLDTIPRSLQASTRPPGTTTTSSRPATTRHSPRTWRARRGSARNPLRQDGVRRYHYAASVAASNHFKGMLRPDRTTRMPCVSV